MEIHSADFDKLLNERMNYFWSRVSFLQVMSKNSVLRSLHWLFRFVFAIINLGRDGVSKLTRMVLHENKCWKQFSENQENCSCMSALHNCLHFLSFNV